MDNKAKLKLTALRLFSEKGYEGTNTRAVAAEAGLAVGTLFKYFGSKEKLLLELVGDGFAEILTRLECQQVPIVANSIHLFREMMEQPFWRFYRIVRHQDNVKEMLKGQSAEFYSRLMEHFRHCLKQENIKEARTTAWYIIALLEGSAAIADNAPDINLDKVLKRGGVG